MKNLIIVISITVLAAGLLFWGKSTPAQKPSAVDTGSTPATFSEQIPSFDFGSISMRKGDVTHEFALTNTTGSDLTINQAETSCMCTNAILILPDGKELGPFGMQGHGFASPVNAIVRSGETLRVRAIFDPAAHGPSGIGKIERAVMLSTTNGQVVMQFQATVTP